MNDPVVYKNGREWDDERVERALSASANTTPTLSDTRRTNVLEALLVENARLTSHIAPATSPQIALWSEDQIENLLSISANATPLLGEDGKKRVLRALLLETALLAAENTPSESQQASLQASLWDESYIDEMLAASARAVPVISETHKATLLQALIAENARLAALKKEALPAGSSIWDRLQNLFNPRVLITMAGAFAALIFAFAYFLLGGSQPPVIAQAYGSFSLSEARQGVLGLRWQVPRTYAGASAADIHVGDMVIATTPVTITFADGTQAIAGVGAQLRMLPEQTIELVSGELLASTTEQTDKFTVQSIGASFVVTNAIFRVNVDETGNVSQFTDAGRVVATTPEKSLEVLAGEQSNVLKDSLPVKALQPPVVAGNKTEDGAMEFTARTSMSSTVVLLDSQTGTELARFKADENGIVNGSIMPPAGTLPEDIEFRADSPDGRKSTVASTVNEGNAITSASNQTTLPPPLPLPSSSSTLPMLSLPALAPAQASSRNGAMVRYSAAASDAADGNVPINCNFASGTTFPIGLTEVVCSATNSQGRVATGSFKVSVVDTLPPIIRLPQSRITVPAISASGAPVTFSVNAMDNVDGQSQVSCNARSGQTFPLGNHTVLCTAADSFGNAAQGSFEVVVRDDAAPALRLPDNITTQATGRNGAEIPFTPAASDQVDGSLPVTCAPASGSAFAVGTTTVTCTATDKSGNTTSDSFVITVRDTTAPVVVVPDAINAQAASAAGAQVAFGATASDLVDGNMSVSCSPRAGSMFPIGQTTVTCRVSDQAGNSATRTFNVNVVDSIAPKLEVPPALNVAATSANGAAVNFTAAATDTIDGVVPVSCSPRSGSTFPLGNNTVTCRATDARGNQVSGTFNVAVRDTTAPALSMPDIITAEAGSAAGVVVNFNAGARDAIDGVIPVTCTPAAGATFPLGSTTVRCSASDKSGNTSSTSFAVNVLDSRPPVLRLPENISAKADSRAGANVTFTVSAADTVDGNLTAACTPRSGAVFGIGDTLVTCRVTDNAGNAATGSFKVSVLNTTPPVLTMPANLTVEATGPNGAPVAFEPAASSIVDGPIVPVCTPAAGATFPLGTTAVTCRATDEAGNTTSDRFNVTVVDTVAPALNLPPNQTAEANNGKRGATVNFDVTAADRVDAAATPVCTPRSGSTFDIGTTAVTCRVTDKSGNTSTNTFNVVVQDTIQPVITTQGNVGAEAASNAGATVNFNVTANDASDGPVPVSCTPRAGGTFPLGTTPVICTAVDQAGKTASAVFNVVVADNTAPVLNVPANITLSSTDPNGAPVSFAATASDAVDGAISPVCTPANGAAFPVGNTTVICTATDRAGNAASGTFVVTVNLIDIAAPTLALPGTITVQATSDAGMVVSYIASANDNLDGAVPATCTPASGSVFPVGPTQVQCSATDRAGNTATGNFMVVVTPAPPVTPTPLPTPTATPTPTLTISETPAAAFTPTTAGQQITSQEVAITIYGAGDLSSTVELTQTVGLPPAPVLTQEP